MKSKFIKKIFFFNTSCFIFFGLLFLFFPSLDIYFSNFFFIENQFISEKFTIIKVFRVYLKNLMIEKMKVELADLLLLFIYVEVMGMIRVYLLNEEIRITYPLIIAITAISRLIILQKKDLDPSILIYESVAILIIAVAIIVLRLRYLTFLKPKRNYK